MLVIVFMCLVWFGCVLVCGWRVNEWFGGLEVGVFDGGFVVVVVLVWV